MFSAKFFIKPEKHNALMLRITNNRKKAELFMGMRLAPEQLLDVMSGKPHPKNFVYSSAIKKWNLLLDKLKIELADNGQTDMDALEIRERFKELAFGMEAKKSAVEKKTAGNFVPFFQEHAATYDRRSTRESNEYTLSTMRKFASETLDSLNFEDINYAWLSDFETYMKRAGLSQNTRKIHFGNIRTAMRDAYKRELTDADPFRRFSFSPAKTRKRSLPVEELRRLFNYPVEPFAEVYRDAFRLIFMLVGINAIDLYNLTAITKGRVEYTRSKTSGLFSIKVEPEALEIIEKYRGEKNLLSYADRWAEYRNFRHQLNRAVSRFGKAQGKGCKDKKEDGPFADVTSYWMRHSWATIAYEIGIPDDVISQALGHQGSGAKVTEVYLRRNMDRIDVANRKVLDWVLYGKRD